MKTRRIFVLQMDVEEEVTQAELKGYLHDSITMWGGQFPPDDPLFGLSEQDVSIKSIPVLKKRRTP